MVHLTTPLAIRVAERFEFYDRPVGYKGHARADAVPRRRRGRRRLPRRRRCCWPASGTRRCRSSRACSCCGRSGRSTTGGPSRRSRACWSRSALAAGLWALGLGWDLGAGAARRPRGHGVVWIVAVVNAFNLFDNMDGAASSMAAVVAGGLAVLGVVEGDTWLAVTGAALCGAALGFLPHNLFASPARIFLGDGGSMPLGLRRRRRGDDRRERARGGVAVARHGPAARRASRRSTPRS